MVKEPDRRQGDTADDTDPTMTTVSLHILQDMEFGIPLSAVHTSTSQSQ